MRIASPAMTRGSNLSGVLAEVQVTIVATKLWQMAALSLAGWYLMMPIKP